MERVTIINSLLFTYHQDNSLSFNEKRWKTWSNYIRMNTSFRFLQVSIFEKSEKSWISERHEKLDWKECIASTELAFVAKHYRKAKEGKKVLEKIPLQ